MPVEQNDDPGDEDQKLMHTGYAWDETQQRWMPPGATGFYQPGAALLSPLHGGHNADHGRVVNAAPNQQPATDYPVSSAQEINALMDRYVKRLVEEHNRIGRELALAIRARDAMIEIVTGVVHG